MWAACWLLRVTVWAATFESSETPSSSPDWNTPRFVYDEKEDEPVTLDVVCSRFLADHVEDNHISALISEMPLELFENMHELTRDEVCKPLATKRCHLLTGQQLVKVIEVLGREGVKAYAQSGCLKRMGKLNPLTVEHVKVLGEVGAFDLEQWYTMQPASLLALMEAGGWNNRPLPTLPTANLNQLLPFLQDQAWLDHPQAWELFDDRFLEAICKSNVQPLQEALLKMLNFERLRKRKEKGTLPPRLKCWSRLALHHHAYLMHMLNHLSPNNAGAESVINQIVAQMTAGAQLKIGLKGGPESRSLRAKLIGVWTTPLWSLSQALAPPPPNELSKQVGLLRRTVGSLSPTLQEALRRHFSLPTTIVNGEALWSLLTSDMMPEDSSIDRFHQWQTLLLRMNLRPTLSPPELAYFKALIARDIAELQVNVERRNPEAGDGTRVSDIPTSLVQWLAQASFVGNAAMFEYLSEQLPGITGDFGITEDALVRLAETMPDLRDAAISLLRRPDRVVQLLVRKLRNESGNENLTFSKNVPLELLESKDRLNVTSDDPTEAKLNEKQRAQVESFLEKSFAFVLQKGLSLRNKSFTIKYKDQKGMDGGGLRRNWIFRILTAMMDPARGFFQTQPGTVGHLMEMAVDPQIYLAFGRLAGRAFYENVGIPQTLHPLIVTLLRARAQEKNGSINRNQFMEKAHDTLSVVHEAFLRALRCYQGAEETDLISTEDFNDLGLAAPAHLHLTTNLRANNYFKPADRDEEAFQAKDWAEARDYALQLEQNIRDAWIGGIDQMYDGLNEFLHADLLASIDQNILFDLFTPKETISDEAWVAAFTLKHGDQHLVQVTEQDAVDAALLQPAPFQLDSSHARVMPMNEAFKLALTRLTAKERLGLIGQLSGAIQVGPAGFNPAMFKVNFRPALSPRSLHQLQQQDEEPIPMEESNSGDTPRFIPVQARPEVDAETLAAPSAAQPDAETLATPMETSAPMEESSSSDDDDDDTEEEAEAEGEDENEGQEEEGQLRRSDDEASQDLFEEPRPVTQPSSPALAVPTVAAAPPPKKVVVSIDLPTAQSW